MLEDDAPPELATLSDDAFKEKFAELLTLVQDERRENQILAYAPVSSVGMAVHESQARVLGIGGGNGCLPLDAPVLMADGSWKSLGEIVVGDQVIAADPVSGKCVPAPVLRTFRSGQQALYRVTFSDGGAFEATANHLVPMYLGSGRTTTKGNGKLPHKRKLGDYIEPMMRRGARNPSKRISCVSPSDIEFLPTKQTLAPYLLGALLGDGSLGWGSLKFSNADEMVLKVVEMHVKKMGLKLVKYQKCDHGIVGERGQGNIAMTKLRELGLWGTNSYTKFIPKEALGWDRLDRLQLLAGLVDTDGTRDSFTSCSPRLAADFAALVRSLGGKATILPRVSKDQNGTVCHSLYVYFRLNERMPLAMPRKQVVNCKGREIDYRRRICRTAELSRVAECGDIEVGHPSHCYITGDYVIVSNSGKSELMLLEIVMAATGVFPDSLKHLAKQKWRGPIACRVILESLTTTLYPVILPKLQHFKWSGVDQPGGERGHWGWIPKWCLVEGSWEKSWTDKLRTLRVLCRDPDDLERVVGESTITFMSKDQDPSDFASGDFHIIGHDEPPTLAIWRESQARTMRVAGRMIVAMTWPDDPAIPVEWIFDEVYEPGCAKQRGIEWFNIYTTDNRNLDQVAIAAQAGDWSTETRNVRLYGQPIRFSNRVHPVFTDHTSHWCFGCGKTCIAQSNAAAVTDMDKWRCEACGSIQVCEFNHVKEFDSSDRWPTVFLLDPHPRRAHCMLWAMVDPSDDLWVIAEAECAGDPVESRKMSLDIERNLMLNVTHRVMDPNMALSPASSKRGVNWRDEFDAAGLACALADDSHVGRERLNQFMKPDSGRWQPRIHIHRRCAKTIHQIKRYTWQDRKLGSERALLQIPKDKDDDFPCLIKYLMNESPTFAWLSGAGGHYQRRGRKGAY